MQKLTFFLPIHQNYNPIRVILCQSQNKIKKSMKGTMHNIEQSNGDQRNHIGNQNDRF